MYLKRLEMQGFKSFADKTVLEFMPGITSVIGPNGSGKSNISDCIRWILGEQSMKSLRGSKTQDIIFSGTQNRKSLGFAEASLVFDNTDSSLPIEYSEVTITRKLYRTGETGYYINKVPCRLKDIIELFMDTGIGRDGYSIIGQGKIDEILSNKSEDRRHIFEEAAGIVKYRSRKEETEKKLEQTKLNLLRINDILTEIEANIEPLQIQSEKAKKFLNYKEELKDLEIGLFIYNLEKYKKELEQLKNNEEIMNSNLNQEEGKLEKIKITKEELKDDIDEIIEKIENMQNIGFESQQEIEKINSNISIANNKIENNIETSKRYEQEIIELDEKINTLKQEQEQKKNKRENLLKNKEKFENELNEKEKELSKITKTLSSKEIEIEGLKKKLDENVENKYELQSQISNNDVNIENIITRKKQIENELNTTILELDKIKMQKEDISKTFYEIESKRNKILKDLEKIEKEKSKIDNEIKEYNNKIEKNLEEIRFKKSRHDFLVETEKEKEGYQKSIKSLLIDCENDKNLGKGMYGILANNISVEKEYLIAIEMALGATLQNVVTETEEDAKRLIQHLKLNNLGRASFLPISSIRGKKIEEIKGKKEGIIGIASDLIKYDKKYEQIILNLLGKTIIEDNIENAIKIAKENKYNFKIVTLQGDIINPSGVISGGSISKKSVNILGREKEIEELEKEIKKLEKQNEKIEVQKNEYIESSGKVIEQLENLRQDLQSVNITYATENQKFTMIDENVNTYKNKIEKLKLEIEKTEENKIKLTKEQEQNKEKIKLIIEKNSEYQKSIEEFSNENKEKQKYIDDLNFDITNLKISVTSFNESENSIQEMTEMINKEISTYTQNKENKKQNIENSKNENNLLKQEIEKNKSEIEKIEYKVKNSKTHIEKLKQDRIGNNEKLEKKEKELNDEYKIIEDLKLQIAKIEVKKSKIEDENTQIINNMWNDYEITPNSITENIKIENIQITQKRVNELKEDIKQLGSVNVDSIEEYKTLKQRYDFMCEQRLDLEETMAKLRKVIQEMIEIMKKQFKENFEIINKNFGEVFKELFGGGSAEVSLTDEENILECGIDITVQPPGKKLQNMTLLSGGEKAFTAIALLFAILKINPAPFCVLDEIEAALDDVNVYRYAEYLKKFAKETQFLIITHRKGTMEAADSVYGVTMEEKGISKLLSIKLK